MMMIVVLMPSNDDQQGKTSMRMIVVMPINMILMKRMVLMFSRNDFLTPSERA